MMKKPNDLSRIVRMAQFKGFRGVIRTNVIEPDRIAFCKDGEVVRFERIGHGHDTIFDTINFDDGFFFRYDDGEEIDVDVVVVNADFFDSL
jgi:hypothetical protein